MAEVQELVLPETEQAAEADAVRSRATGFQYTQGAYRPPQTGAERPREMAPQPLPKRPKGRIVVGSLLLMTLGFFAFSLWNSFFRFEAYGVVSGNIVDIAASIDGPVRSVHVEEGDSVQAGRPLVTLNNLEAEQKRDRVRDELQLARAALVAETAKLQWQIRSQENQRYKAQADYHEAWSRFQREAAELSRRSDLFKRAKSLKSLNAISEQQFEHAFYDEKAQREQLAALEEALTAWRERAASASHGADGAFDQLRSTAAKIEVLKEELIRAEDIVQQCEVRAPIDGDVIRRHQTSGQYASKKQPLISILEAGSLQVELFLPQNITDSVQVGDELDLAIPPRAKYVRARIVRIGSELESPPAQIARFYRDGQKLLPVFLKPVDAEAVSALRIGTVVKLPRSWFRGRAPSRPTGH